MFLNGIHHVTAVSSQIGRNVDFYTNLLGLRLVKKSVNQDDVSAYHLFYADKVGSPGTDMTSLIGPTLVRISGERTPSLRQHSELTITLHWNTG